VTGTRWHLQPHPFFSSPPDLLHLTSIFVSLLEEAILIFVEFKTCCFLTGKSFADIAFYLALSLFLVRFETDFSLQLDACFISFFLFSFFLFLVRNRKNFASVGE
jgi:hypothetical protein